MCIRDSKYSLFTDGPYITYRHYFSRQFFLALVHAICIPHLLQHQCTQNTSFGILAKYRYRQKLECWYLYLLKTDCKSMCVCMFSLVTSYQGSRQSIILTSSISAVQSARLRSFNICTVGLTHTRRSTLTFFSLFGLSSHFCSPASASIYPNLMCSGIFRFHIFYPFIFLTLS